jgi:hypothetical protein
MITDITSFSKPAICQSFQQQNINDTFNFRLMRIAERVDDYQNYGSGWEFYRVEKIFIEVTQFQLPTGAGYIKFFKDLAMKKGVINPANDMINASSGQS